MSDYKRWQVMSTSESKGEDDGDYIDRIIQAPDARTAAEKGVSSWWYEDPDSGDIRWPVKVREAGGPDDAPWARFVVEGEPCISWHTRESVP